MALVYNYLFPVMWLSFLAYWWAISRNVKETERQESAASRLTRLVLIVCAAALLWLSKRSARFAKRAISSRRCLVFLERRGHYRRWSTLCCLGASSPRKKLEPGRHPEGRSQTHYQWPLCPGPPPHLYRVSTGVCRLRSRPWRVARAACGSPCLRRTMAQTKARGEMDARAIRRVV